MGLAIAFWLKYNAAAYGLPLAVAVAAWTPPSGMTWRQVAEDLGWIVLGFVVVGAAVLAYFAAHRALDDLRLATLDYNLRYSNETYDGIPGLVRYLVTFPIVRARVEPLWFVGGLGTALLLLRARASASSLVVFGWMVAAIVSIAINGGRSLPNYFVQANPALALAASAGLAQLSAPPGGFAPRLSCSSSVPSGASVPTPRCGACASRLSRAWSKTCATISTTSVERSIATPTSRGFAGRNTTRWKTSGSCADILATTTPADPDIRVWFLRRQCLLAQRRASASRFFWSRPVTH